MSVSKRARRRPHQRYTTVDVRFSPAELAEVERLAAAAGLSAEAFMRRALRREFARLQALMAAGQGVSGRGDLI